MEPAEEYELIFLNKLLKIRASYRKRNGAISFNNNYSKISFTNGNVNLEKIETSEAHNLVSEAMILMGNVFSEYLNKYKIPAPFRSQKINCNSKDILEKNYYNPVKYIILKQYIGKSYTSLKAKKHETLGLNSYVQSTSPLRRYLDLLVQRQISLNINNKPVLNEEIINQEIDFSNKRQMDNYSQIKENKLYFLRKFFDINNKNNKLYKIIFIRWINPKKNIALVFFPDYSLELLINLYISIDTYPNKIYKVKYIMNENSNLLEFIN